MSLFSLTQCSKVLGIDPKTLRSWLYQDPMPLVPHPTDARIKCLTSDQVQQLAVLHGRPLVPQTAPATPGPAISLPPPIEEASSGHAMSTMSSPLPQETDLLKQLSCLETRVATLSEQVAQLALLLLHERERTIETRLTQVETTLQALAGKSAPSPVLPDQETTISDNQLTPMPKPARPLHPTKQRARSRMPPLIEYQAQGTSVIVSSQDGEVQVEPNSPAWFEWLATVSSFRFVGKQGRFTAYRDTSHGRPTRGWVAYRRIHGRTYRHGLGVTNRLTITHLEQMATTFQSYEE